MAVIKSTEPVKASEPNPPVNRLTEALKPAGRDFNAEARGKTRCALYQAALQSQILAQLFYAKASIDLDEVKKVARELADDGVKYTFGE